MSADCLPDEEIASILSKFFEVRVSAQEMRQLKPEFVQKMYCNFLLDFAASMEQINQLPFDVCDSVRQHPQSYASSGRIMILAKVISHFLKRLNKDVDFFPADLFDPNPKRTRRFFSLLIDFYASSRDNIESLTAIEDKAKIKYDAKCDLMEDSAKKEERLKHLKHENESIRIREEQMMKRIAEVRDDMHETQIAKVDTKSKLDQVKVDIASLTADIKAAELEIMEKKERLEVLASQVIQASERKEIERREAHLASYRSDNAIQNENLASIKQTVDVIKSALELISNELLPILQDIQQEMTGTNECMLAIAKSDRGVRSCLEETEEQDMKIQQVKGILVSRQEKISQLQIAWKLKKDVLQGEINQLKETWNEIWRSQTEDEIVSQDLLKERLKIIQEAKLLKEQIHQFDLFVAKNFQKILQTIEKHNSEIQAGLTAVVEVSHMEYSDE
ncbi:kinetochore protein Nuf2-like [Palaemon carinicauda]|uniref:kinetochore protein Nuf2-like n=1 Tax=Palaemon carinicauda TaxID=392227 RepID=UPI0035B5E701